MAGDDDEDKDKGNTKDDVRIECSILSIGERDMRANHIRCHFNYLNFRYSSRHGEGERGAKTIVCIDRAHDSVHTTLW